MTKTFADIVEQAAKAYTTGKFKSAADLYRRIRWYDAANFCDKRAKAKPLPTIEATHYMTISGPGLKEPQIIEAIWHRDGSVDWETPLLEWCEHNGFAHVARDYDWAEADAVSEGGAIFAHEFIAKATGLSIVITEE